MRPEPELPAVEIWRRRGPCSRVRAPGSTSSDPRSPSSGPTVYSGKPEREDKVWKGQGSTSLPISSKGEPKKRDEFKLKRERKCSPSL